MKFQYKQFNQLTMAQLGRYFHQKGYKSNIPFLLSFDGDKTIVDRERGAHYMSDSVKAMFSTLSQDNRFIVSMNTGRDATNYRPLLEQTGHREPNVFVSGRVIHHQGKIYTHPQAVFSKELKAKLWDNFKRGIIPFLDVKHGKGNTFFVQGGRGLNKYYGHHRPVDWFDDLEKELVDIDTVEGAREMFNSLDIVRVEIPLLYKDEPVEVLEAINQGEQEQVGEIAKERLNIQSEVDLLFVPAPTNKTRGDDMRKEVGSIRVLVHDKYVNKGVGLQKLARMVGVPGANIVYFGDSAADKANDVIVKTILPRCTLIITDNGEEEAKSFADFVIEPVSEDGVPKAVDKLIKFQEMYSTISAI